MTAAELKSLLKKEGLKVSGNKDKMIANLRRLPADKDLALRMASSGICCDVMIGDSLRIPSKTIRKWWKKAGIPPAIPWRTDSGQLNPELVDRTKEIVFDMMRNGYYNTQISTAIQGVLGYSSGYQLQLMSEWRKESGIPIPPTAGRPRKYFDDELIELAYLNQGATVKRFAFMIGVDEGYLLQLFEDLREYTNGEENLFSFLEDISVRQEFNWGLILDEPFEIRVKRRIWQEYSLK